MNIESEFYINCLPHDIMFLMVAMNHRTHVMLPIVPLDWVVSMNNEYRKSYLLAAVISLTFMVGSGNDKKVLDLHIYISWLTPWIAAV